VVAGPAHGPELGPGRGRDLERGALHERETVRRVVATGQLGREGQEELVEQPGGEQVADEVRAALAEDQARTAPGGNLDQRRRRDRPAGRGDRSPGTVG